jgi:transposase
MIIDECGQLQLSYSANSSTNLSTGARLVYLPPYSPDFNPIEEAFSMIKAWLKRHEQEFTNAASLQWMIHQAAAAISEKDAVGWFRDCGYL